jgi:DNA-binding transcriptional ArsR family regulator
MPDYEKAEACEFIHLHTDVVEKAREALPDEEKQYALAELFSMFADTTRIRILYALFEAEMCVCDLANLLGMTQSAVSHQLALLKRARLVRPRRDGRSVFYSLADSHVRTMLDQGMEHVEE